MCVITEIIKTNSVKTLKNLFLCATKPVSFKPVFILLGALIIVACNETRSVDNKDVTAADSATTSEIVLPAQPATTSSIASQQSTEFDQFEELYLDTEATHSIWPRVREGFQLPDDIKHKALQNEVKWFAKHHAYMQRVLQRADPFLYYILEEAEKRKLPTELVLLPIVESAYQPFAYSHGRAAGLWQFIPATGRLYGLKQNWWYDGRRDIYESTQAALNYLDNLNKIFRGNWLHALAAYNSGPGNVQKAIRHNKRRGKPTDFWHLKLPRETRTYVPKLLALKQIVSNPDTHDISLRCIPYAPGFKQVDAGSQIDLALAAELADIELDTLYRYNPAFNRWSTAPDGPHKLLLPSDAAEIFTANLEQLPEKQRVRWKRHRIKEGETLGHIALRYKTTAKQLRKVNNIRGNRIRAGKHLLIPVASRSHRDYALSAPQRKQATQNRSRGNNKTRVDHIVKSGESFWLIARRYKVSMHSLAKWNGMAVRDQLREGQKIVIWTKNGKPSSRTARAGTIQKLTHTVRNGDSLSRIASRYHVRVADLHRWNKIKGKYLQPGQKLRVYVDVTRQTTGRT
jgi:membrane-bound lytic murein transglycosylase D